jgi:hypothetical protein
MPTCVHTSIMSPKERFAVMFEPEQLKALRAIESRVGIPIGEQIRRAVQAWLEDDRMGLKVLEEIDGERKGRLGVGRGIKKKS